MIKSCIFDLDGTLLNTLPTIRHYVNLTLSEFGLGSVSEKDVKKMVGNGSKKLIERALLKNGASLEDFEKIHKFYSDSYDEDVTYLTHTYDGIPELLAELKTMGIKIAVLSNKPDFAAKEAVKTFLGDLVDVTYGGRDDVPLKPSPDGVYQIMEELGVKEGESLFIGDSSVDMKTGKNAGLFTIGVKWGFRDEDELIQNGADKIVSSPEMICDIINSRKK